MLWHLFETRQRWSMFAQILIASATTICVCMAFLVYFISRQLQTSMMQTAAEEGAVLVDVFLGPSLQELATSPVLSPAAIRNLDELLKTTIGERTKALKVWLRDGTLIYATDKQLVGQNFPSAKRGIAFEGEAFGSFADTGNEEHKTERHLEHPLTEIYAPIYKTGTRDVIAVGEVYNSGARLASELSTIRGTTVTIVGAITAPMMFALFLMVWRANAAVIRHRLSLHRRIDEARALAKQNVELRQMAEAVQLSSMHSNERLLGQIGQDLHDGPVQLASVLALKLSEFDDIAPGEARDHLKANVLDLTSTILKELRDISTGLVLPELVGLTAGDVLRLAVSLHERNTGTEVACEIDTLAFHPSPLLRVCMFRVVQECLNNAYAHGNGNQQRVAASESSSVIAIVVSNAVAVGHRSRQRRKGGTGLGLLGLQRRVYALRGSFHLEEAGDRVQINVRLPTNI